MLEIFLSVLLVSLISFIGIFFVLFKKRKKGLMLVLVSFAIGSLLAGAFLDLLPEALESLGASQAFGLTLAGFLIFFVSERFLLWRHCHAENCKAHSFAYMNLLGDGIHNFLDGVIIAVSYLTHFSLGVTSTIAIIFHEIPQEIGDFSVMLYGGFTTRRALLMNFLTSLTAMAGAILAYFLQFYIKDFVGMLLPVAAGGFLYIASSDLLPELEKMDIKKSFLELVFIILGIALMYFLKIFLQVT